MNRELFNYYDNNILTLKAHVKSTIKEDNLFGVVFDKTPFRPSSGGQPYDKGWLVSNGRKIEIVKATSDDKGDIIHWVKESPDSKEVELIVDRDRRARFTKLHSAEHIFFGSLKRVNETADVYKINLDETPQIFIKADSLSYDDIFKAEVMTREVIKKGLKRIIHYRSRDDLNDLISRGLRIKEDRIKDDFVRIVEFDGYDLSACSGTHVENTREIEDFLVTNFKREKDYYVVSFVVGEEAERRRQKLSEEARLLRKLIGKDNLIKEVKELIESKSRFKQKYHYYLLKYLKTLKADRFSHFLFDNEESKVLIRGIKNLCSKNTVLFVNKKGELNEVILCSQDGADCERIIKELLKEGGKGGGGKDFAVCSTPLEPDKIVEFIKQKVLKQE